MNQATKPFDPTQSIQTSDGFDVLDSCHRQTLFTLGKLSALIARLEKYREADDGARELAREIHHFFSTTGRQHHEDEERHVFPALEASDDAELVDVIHRLQQDHHWLEADWAELAPQLDAIAGGQSWWELDTLRRGAEVFTALSHDHIALEESMIYPQARQRIAGNGRNEMSREMAARRHAKATERA
ncbi:hemerythrin domain-containing protein [Piscinibacter sakaiensis]|uniref:hemerythrin domain-containing protein n=1 Tax=Piscinibacter sakaiensis TaxID=1547922 RepID=UPI003AAF6CF2